jgi:cytochrome c-type biogenesis protein CcmH/NrfF
VKALGVAVAAALLLAAPAAACVKHASQSDLESKLVCLQCHTTLDESDSLFATEMKAEIARRIARCQSERQILDAMVGQFGPEVLSTPQTRGFDLLAWVLPIGGILLGAAALAAGAWHWSRGRDASNGLLQTEHQALPPEDERLVDEELARFDA